MISNATNNTSIRVTSNDELEAARAEIEGESLEAMIPVHLDYGLMLIEK